MRIVIAGLAFPDVGPILKRELPTDDIQYCPEDHLPSEMATIEVLVPSMARITVDLLGRADNLKLIQQWGIGLEGVDLVAATARSIPVCNVPADAAPDNAISTAELAIFLMMAVARRWNQSRKTLLHGPWGGPQGLALTGRRALIVGLGRVGQALAVRLKACGMELYATKAHPDQALATTLGLEELTGPEGMTTLLSKADFIVSTVVATPETGKLFNGAVFDRMKPGAVFVNVSRGAVVDETALLKALNDGHLAGAGLDVFAREPVRADHPLLAHEAVVAMPHVGGSTEQADEEVGRVVVANINRVRAGKKPYFRANN